MKKPFPGFNVLLGIGGSALAIVFSTALSLAQTTEAQPVVQAATEASSVATNTLVEGPAPETNLTNLSPAILEIGRMAQSGVSEEVILAYIKTADVNSTPTAEEILYLQDLGLSDSVITAVINRAREVREQSTAQAAAAVPAPVETNAATTSLPPAPPSATPAEVVAVQPPAQQVNVTYFYQSLSPYGTWVDVPGYGLCWRPTVVTVNSGWRPYADRGRWIYTDCGWYWQSDYSWGWATFHYGRWHSSPAYGWVWVPGSTWGPAWVSWRYSDNYCGWAPLPPEAHYHDGVGFSYRSSRVGFSFEFGLRDSYYTFVPVNRFCERDLYRHYVPRSHAHVVYNNTVVNNYYIHQNNVVVNRGIAPERIVAATRKPIREVAIRDVPKKHVSRSDVVDRHSNTLYVHRPELRPADFRPNGGRGHEPFGGGRHGTGQSSKPTHVNGGHGTKQPTAGRPADPSPFSPVAPAQPVTPSSGSDFARNDRPNDRREGGFGKPNDKHHPAQDSVPGAANPQTPIQANNPRPDHVTRPEKRAEEPKLFAPPTHAKGDPSLRFAPQLAKPANPTPTPAKTPTPLPTVTIPKSHPAGKPAERAPVFSGNQNPVIAHPSVNSGVIAQPNRPQPRIAPGLQTPVTSSTPSVQATAPQATPKIQQHDIRPKNHAQVQVPQSGFGGVSTPVARPQAVAPSWNSGNQNRTFAQPSAPVVSAPPTFRSTPPANQRPVITQSAPPVRQAPVTVAPVMPQQRAPVVQQSAPAMRHAQPQGGPGGAARGHQGGGAPGQMKKERR